MFGKIRSNESQSHRKFILVVIFLMFFLFVAPLSPGLPPPAVQAQGYDLEWGVYGNETYFIELELPVTGLDSDTTNDFKAQLKYNATMVEGSTLQYTTLSLPYGVALYNQSTALMYVKDTTDAGYADRTFQYGPPGNNWLPVAGDWNGNGESGLALYAPGSAQFYVKDTSAAGHADRTFAYGPAPNTWLPVAGRW